MLLLPSIASAVGLGRLTVLSVLGQPLNAEVELVSVPNDELSTLSARQATLATDAQDGRQHNAGIAGLLFRIEKRADGRPYIKLSSEQSVNEPFVDLLLELNWASGRLVREYTLLIDPPNYAPTQALAPVPAAAPLPRVVAAPLPAAPALATQSAMTPAAGNDYGPIKRGETLSRIATRVKPQNVTLEQMMVGIFRSNPEAFINNNMNRLKADRMLRIPNREYLLAIPQIDVTREIRGQITDRGKLRQKPAANPRAKDKPAGSKSVLRLSSSKPASEFTV